MKPWTCSFWRESKETLVTPWKSLKFLHRNACGLFKKLRVSPAASCCHWDMRFSNHFTNLQNRWKTVLNADNDHIAWVMVGQLIWINIKKKKNKKRILPPSSLALRKKRCMNRYRYVYVQETLNLPRGFSESQRWYKKNAREITSHWKSAHLNRLSGTLRLVCQSGVQNPLRPLSISSLKWQSSGFSDGLVLATTCVASFFEVKMSTV